MTDPTPRPDGPRWSWPEDWPAHLTARTDERELPRTADPLPRLGGEIKVEPEDFVVEELPAYPPSGEGAHVYLWLQKRDWAWHALSKEIARRLDMDRRDIGAAGQKDRRAVTRQWVSVPEAVAPRLGELDHIEGVAILEVSRHNNKLKTGHNRGNRFEIVVRDVEVEDADTVARAIAERVSDGIPNLYAQQRFGRDGRTAADGWLVLQGRTPKPLRRDRRRLRLCVSALQSALFNDYSVRRIEAGLARQVVRGDLLAKRDTGGLFVCEDPAADQPRLEAGEIEITGPMYGSKLWAAEHEAGELEQSVLSDAGITAEDFGSLGKLALGTRRSFWVRADELDARAEGGQATLKFALPSGSYATLWVREFTG